jgi:hypothetical protein
LLLLSFFVTSISRFGLQYHTWVPSKNLSKVTFMQANFVHLFIQGRLSRSLNIFKNPVVKWSAVHCMAVSLTWMNTCTKLWFFKLSGLLHILRYTLVTKMWALKMVNVWLKCAGSN